MAESDPDPERAPRRPPRRRRPPPPPPLQPPAAGPGRRSDIYVNMQTDFRAQLSRCQKLLGGGEICVHGLGLAIHRAINLALQLQAAAGGTLRLAARTSTVALHDDHDDHDGDERDGAPPPPLARPRHNSAIHIRLCRPA